jgi:hypothetical protein
MTCLSHHIVYLFLSLACTDPYGCRFFFSSSSSSHCRLERKKKKLKVEPFGINIRKEKKKQGIEDDDYHRKHIYKTVEIDRQSFSNV